MNSVIKFVKKHINAIVAIGVIVLIVIGLFILKDIFFPEENVAIYGNRLEGRDKVKISDATKKKVKEDLKEGTKSVEVRIAGRIIYVDVVVNDDVSKETARSLGDKAVAVFSDKEKAYYDIQILINNKANQNQFPIIGYKHHTKGSISWTKDR